MFSAKWQGDTRFFQPGVLAVENGNDTLPHRCLHRKQIARNLDYNQDLDPNEMIIVVVDGDDALNIYFACVLQQRFLNCKNFGRRREVRAAQQTVVELEDKGVVEVS